MKSIRLFISKLFNSDLLRRRLTALLVLVALILHIVSINLGDRYAILAGVLYWLSLVLLWPDVSERNIKLVKWMTIVALPGLIFGIINGREQLLYSTLTTNNGIITLLIAVGFFSLGTTSSVSSIKTCASNGLKGYLATYTNVHLIGSVINYAAVLIYGDRLTQHKKMTVQQAILLSRSFAAAGFWSPLFITMAVATSYSPGYEYSTILFAGILMTIVSFAYSFLELFINNTHSGFEGIDISIETLRMPVLIAFAIGATIYLLPGAKIVNIVIITALIYGLFVTAVSTRKLPLEYIFNRFPLHANELALFLSAALLNASLVNLIQEFRLDLVQQLVTPMVCTLFVIVSLLLTHIGIHPLISITVFVSLTHVTPETSNLMAFSLFSAWAIGSSLGPLSGQNIGISTRYAISSYEIMKGNLIYSWVLVSISALIIYFIL